MQNLIPGVSWGKTMHQKQFDKMYQRMMQREKKKQQEIQKEQDRKKDDDLVGCTFQPQTNNLEPGSRVNRRSPVKHKAPRKAQKGVSKTEKDQQILRRIEEMARRDKERKEKTRRKHEERQKKEFSQVHTFQPNKNKRGSLSRRASARHSKDSKTNLTQIGGDTKDVSADKDNQIKNISESHFRQESDNVVGNN